MTTKNVKELLAVLGNRPLVIWGARMTGIGLLRFSQKHQLKVLGFVDSDPSFLGKKIYDLPVILPQSLFSLKAKEKNLLVVIAVSIKEDEIIEALKKMGISSGDYLLYKNFAQKFFTLDVSGTCNLKCPSCPNSLCPVDRPRGFMSLADFKKITQKILKEVGLVSHFSLYNWGEPLLHPQLDLLIDYAHQMGIAIAVSSNFSITSAEQLQKLVKAGPDILKISVSGYYPQIYNTTHTGGDVNLVKSNLYRLKYYLEKEKSSFVVDVNYHLYKNNLGADLKKMRELCQELGFIFSTCYATVMPVERLIDYCQGKKVDQKTQALLDLLLVSIDKGLQITRPFHDRSCGFLNQININWDRSVALCCASFDRETTTVSADFLKDSLGAIEKKKHSHKLCRECCRLGIPQYLLGPNQKEWKKEADKQSFSANIPSSGISANKHFQK